jgi:hypothetical protein
MHDVAYLDLVRDHLHTRIDNLFKMFGVEVAQPQESYPLVSLQDLQSIDVVRIGVLGPLANKT